LFLLFSWLVLALLLVSFLFFFSCIIFLCFHLFILSSFHIFRFSYVHMFKIHHTSIVCVASARCFIEQQGV
jgi:hypothetical protein